MGPGELCSSGFFVDGLMWHDLLTALALMLVIEGVLPFLSPARLRRLLLQVAQSDDRQLRTAGLITMLAGVLLLHLLR